MSQQLRGTVLFWVSPESDPQKVYEHKEVWEVIPKSPDRELEKESRKKKDGNIRWGNEQAIVLGNCGSFQMRSYGGWYRTLLKDVPFKSQGCRGYLSTNSQQSLGEEHSWGPLAYPHMQRKLKQKAIVPTAAGTMGQSTLEWECQGERRECPKYLLQAASFIKQ